MEKTFDYLYGNLILSDFAALAQDNIININSEDYIYNELSFDEINKIINHKKIASRIDGANILNIGSGAGQLMFMLQTMYSPKILCGLENTFELYSLSKEILEKYRSCELLKKDNITFIMNDPLLMDFSNFDVIFIEYNNTNTIFRDMLKEKIKQECKKNTLIVKFVNRFKEDKKIKLLDVIKSDSNVYLYLLL